jgi:hypothetical protein
MSSVDFIITLTMLDPTESSKFGWHWIFEDLKTTCTHTCCSSPHHQSERGLAEQASFSDDKIKEKANRDANENTLAHKNSMIAIYIDGTHQRRAADNSTYVVFSCQCLYMTPNFSTKNEDLPQGST